MSLQNDITQYMVAVEKGNPTPDETAAAIGAIERFLTDTAPSQPQVMKTVSNWKETALREGVEHEPM